MNHSLYNRIKIRSVLLLIIAPLSLVSCGGGGGSDSSALPPERPTGLVDGHAVDAVIVGGTISVYAFKEGVKGELLGSAVTDDEGFYALNLSAPSQPVLIEITGGGSYVEEASGRSVNLQDDQVLRAVTYYESGHPVTVMVTPLTNLAAGLITHKIANGTNVENAITEASTAISTIFGLDILSTYPRNITDVRNATVALTDEHLYGFWTAAISSWTAWASEQNGTPAHTVWTSIGLAQIMFNDIQTDGKLDGQGSVNNRNSSFNLGLGTVLLNTDVYRQSFAQHLLNMANSERNKTGIDANQLLAEANNLASNTHAAFGSATPKPLDDEGPVVIAIEPEGQYHNSVFQFDIGISDFVGVESVRFDVDGSLLDYASEPAVPSINIDTTRYLDGDHLIGVRAIDKLGNETYRQFAVIFDNTSPFVNITSKTVTNQATFTLTGSYQDNGIGVQSVTAQGRAAVLLQNGTWSVSVVLENGVNSIPVIILDALENPREVEVLVALDVVKPVMNPVVYSLAKYSFGDGTYFEGNLINADGGSTPLYIETSNVDLNGIPFITTSLSGNDIPYIAFTVEDNNVNGVFTPSSEIIVRLQYTLANKVLSPWHNIVPAENSVFNDFYIVPLASESLSTDWYIATPDNIHLIEVQLEDNAGNVRNFTFSFKVDFIVPEPVITVQDIGQPTFSNIPFNQRAQLHGAEIATTSYTFINDTGKSYLIQVEDSATHYVNNTIEEAIRENKVRLQTTTEWRLRYYYVLRVDSLNCPTVNPEISDWIPVTSILNWDTSGNTVLPQDIPAPVTGTVTSAASDNPVPPAATTWASFHLDSDHYTVDLSAFFMPNWHYDYLYGIGFPAYVNVPSCNFESNLFQQREVYTYLIEPGYPRNNYATFSEQATFDTSGITVEDGQGNSLTLTNDWYTIPAGATITIKKTVTTPAMNIYNDTDVGDPNSFTSYTTHQYDKTLTWSIDSDITLTRTHDAGPTKTFAMTALESTISQGITAYQISR